MKSIKEKVAMERSSYSFYKTVDLDFETAVKRAKEVLKEEGFGVLTEIDVKKTLKEKLGVDFRPYLILGACNPPNAYRALQAEEQIGLMLPCNVIVYQNAEGNTVVAAIDPVASMQAIENPGLGEVARTVQEKLKSVIDKI